MKLVFSTLASRVGTTMRRYAGPRQYRPLRLEALEERFFLAANVWLDFTDFGTELNKAVAKANETLDPDVTPFSTSEIKRY